MRNGDTTSDGVMTAERSADKTHNAELTGRGQPVPFDVDKDVLSSTFRKACLKLEIVDATFHDARATALTRLSKRLNVLELARMVGHRDIRSLQIYYRETAEELANRLD